MSQFLSPTLHRVFVTGGSGFVGRRVIEALLAEGYAVKALIREKPIEREGVENVKGDLKSVADVGRCMEGCQSVIHLVGIIRETAGQSFDLVHRQFTQNVVEAAKQHGIRRYLHMSAEGVGPQTQSAYAKTKWEGERLVRESGLDWTIFQPSMIHGRHGEFTQQVAGWTQGRELPFLFLPFFGGGLLGQTPIGKLAPVWVEDVARSFVTAIGRPEAFENTYHLSGPEVFNWPSFLKLASATFYGKRTRPIGIPAWYAKLLASVAPSSLLPFDKGMVQMATDYNAGDNSAWRRDLGIEPARYEEAAKGYAGDVLRDIKTR